MSKLLNFHFTQESPLHLKTFASSYDQNQSAPNERQTPALLGSQISPSHLQGPSWGSHWEPSLSQNLHEPLRNWQEPQDLHVGTLCKCSRSVPPKSPGGKERTTQPASKSCLVKGLSQALPTQGSLLIGTVFLAGSHFQPK